TGVGKVLLAHGTPELVEEDLDGPLGRFTPKTITDPEVLRRELASCRLTGTVAVREELTPGADSVATRVVDGRGRVVAALSVVVRAGTIQLHSAVPSLVSNGLGLSRSIGCRPGIPVHAG
ncbi:MAG: IclR family transcriptional regulator domain-containing protein, partial [Trebonia sp.]